MDSRFWTAFFAGTLLHSSIVHALMGNLKLSILLGAIGIFEIYFYGLIKSTEEDKHGDE